MPKVMLGHFVLLLLVCMRVFYIYIYIAYLPKLELKYFEIKLFLATSIIVLLVPGILGTFLNKNMPVIRYYQSRN